MHGDSHVTNIQYIVYFDHILLRSQWICMTKGSFGCLHKRACAVHSGRPRTATLCMVTVM